MGLRNNVSRDRSDASSHTRRRYTMRKSRNDGITPRGSQSIQYDFIFRGIRYRPSLKRTPTEANLRRAREHLAVIKERNAAGSFQFAEEFPAYRHLDGVMS